MHGQNKAAGVPRTTLNQLCQVQLLVPTWESRQDDAGLWHARLSLSAQNGDPVGEEFDGSGRSKDDAEDDAAAKAFDALTRGAVFAAPGVEQRSLAHVGDAALDLLVSLLARSRGMDNAATDSVRQVALSNPQLGALGGGAPGTRAHGAATRLEAAVGAAVWACEPQLRELLENAVSAVDPQLLNDVRAALDRRPAL